MVGVFYFATAFILAVLPALNGYGDLSFILVILALISPVKILLMQWAIVLVWVVTANIVFARAHGSFQIPDEYYLYLSYGVVFLFASPFYISHSQKFDASRARLLLVVVRYVLFILAVMLLLSTLFRTYPLSNGIWALICCLYGLYLPRPNTPPMNAITIAGYAILFVLLTLTTLALLEVGVRLFLVVPPEPGGLRMSHPEAIVTLRPHAKSSIIIKDNDERIISPLVEISSQGIRDREYGPKSEDEYRIILLGDSFTMGHGLEAKDTIDTVLEGLLQQKSPDCNIHVINCGVGAYGPWQERIFLRERGFPLKPDLVILQLFPRNDVADSYRKVGKLLHAVNVENMRRSFDMERHHELPLRVERKVQRYSSAYRLIDAAMGSNGIVQQLINACRFFTPMTYPRIVPRTQRHPLYEACLVDWYPELEEAWDIYARSIAGIRDDCWERGVDLIAYVHGDQTSLSPETWDTLNEQFPDTPYEPDKDIRLTNELLDKLGIASVDVFSDLMEYPADEVFYKYDGHFNPKGAEVVAASLRDYLIEEYWRENPICD